MSALMVLNAWLTPAYLQQQVWKWEIRKWGAGRGVGWWEVGRRNEWMAGSKTAPVKCKEGKRLVSCLEEKIQRQSRQVKKVKWGFIWAKKWKPTPVFLLENPMDGGAWWATVHGVAKSQTRLRDLTFTFMLSKGEQTNRWVAELSFLASQSCGTYMWNGVFPAILKYKDVIVICNFNPPNVNFWTQEEQYLLSSSHWAATTSYSHSLWWMRN